MVDTARDDRTQDPSMIERVTTAIADLRSRNEEIRSSDLARAAIAAMREPTDEMKLVASDASGEEIFVGGELLTKPILSEAECGNIWRVMIDEAMKE